MKRFEIIDPDQDQDDPGQKVEIRRCSDEHTDVGNEDPDEAEDQRHPEREGCAHQQTFLLQLCGPGTYVPSRRSVAGGSYGSMPASNVVGPEGGWRLAERTVTLIQQLWSEQ